MVIMCRKTYDKVIKTVYGEGEDAVLNELTTKLRGIQCRNPVLWLSQVMNMRVWNADEFSYHLATTYGIRLEEYLPPKYNQDLILLDVYSVLQSRSDVDGDLSPVFFLPYSEDLPKFNDMEACKEEQAWIADYTEGEFDADSTMQQEMVYKLYETKLSSEVNQTSRKTIQGYSEFLYQAMEAKAAIGEQKYIYS